ncbi:MAG: carboxypeptidase-like regulatory domain-containing protein [Planctomycetota bacterium]|nr:carboxypeptidase-like regulatory domain-containing protein [Planctomycetota bacterium]
MPRTALLLIAAAVAGVALFLVFGPLGDDTGSMDDDVGFDDDVAYEEDPTLRATGTGKRPDKDRNGGGKNGDGKTPPPAKDIVVLAGTVIDARTRAPLANAALRLEPAGTPCPRMPSHDPNAANPLESLDDVQNVIDGRTADDGTFEITRPAGSPLPGPVDLFVLHKGYVTACVCRATGTDLVIRMEPGAAIAGRVVNTAGHPIEGAQVQAAPLEGEPRVPGVVAGATTDREGVFRLEGLAAGTSVMITADHPAHVPTTVGPRESGDTTPFDIRLVPAYRVTFQLRTDDGEPVKNPTIRWVTDGDPPVEDLRILKGTASGPPARRDSEMTTETLRIPCNRRVVDFEIKSDGYLPWALKGEPLPPDGGARTYPVVLERDMTVGALRIKLEDKEGKALSYAESKAELGGLTWLGPRDQMPTSFVMQASEVLDLPSMKAGPYRILVQGAAFAPVTLDVTVVPAQTTEKVLVVGEPAKLAVRFIASEPLTVRFRITQDGRVVRAFPEGKETAQPTAEGVEPLTASGDGEALILSGLGAGSYVVEILNKELVATTRTVRLALGETQEVEIEVQRR